MSKIHGFWSEREMGIIQFMSAYGFTDAEWQRDEDDVLADLREYLESKERRAMLRETAL